MYRPNQYVDVNQLRMQEDKVLTVQCTTMYKNGTVQWDYKLNMNLTVVVGCVFNFIWLQRPISTGTVALCVILCRFNEFEVESTLKRLRPKPGP